MRHAGALVKAHALGRAVAPVRQCLGQLAQADEAVCERVLHILEGLNAASSAGEDDDDDEGGGGGSSAADWLRGGSGGGLGGGRKRRRDDDDSD